MINSKTEYYEYLEADRQANKKKKSMPICLGIIRIII